MTEKLMVKCRKCGTANNLRLGRIYTIFHCSKCGEETDLDATLTFELVPEDRPVKLIRDTVTVGFRPRQTTDRLKCEVCGATAEVELEDVLGEERTYRCSQCGNRFGRDDRGGAATPGQPDSLADK